MKRILWFWLPTIGYMAAIFYLSSRSRPFREWGYELPSDYILHFLEYFLLALLLMRLLLSRLTAGNGGDFAGWHSACLLGAIITILYGMSDEIHQYFVPGRCCSLSDLLSDGIGALLAYSVAMLDYLVFKYCRSWIRFLRQRRLIRMVSYAGYSGIRI